MSGGFASSPTGFASSGDEPRPPDDNPSETSRVEAFSDGVFAIAITLLVLELKTPRVTEGSTLAVALLRQWPSYLAFLTSFATIGIMWLNHHRLFNYIQRVDHSLLILNGMLLLGVTVTPFPTATVAEWLGRPGERLAAAFYSGTFVYIAIAFNALWRYASSPKRRVPLLTVPHDDVGVRAIHEQYRWGPFVYLVALAASGWNATFALSINLALALFFAFPPAEPKPLVRG